MYVYRFLSPVLNIKTKLSKQNITKSFTSRIINILLPPKESYKLSFKFIILQMHLKFHLGMKIKNTNVSLVIARSSNHQILKSIFSRYFINNYFIFYYSPVFYSPK